MTDLDRFGVRHLESPGEQTVTTGVKLGHEAEVTDRSRPGGREDEDIFPATLGSQSF